jgi:ArsR family transcriptional regulator
MIVGGNLPAATPEDPRDPGLRGHVQVAPETTSAMHLLHERICKSIGDPKRLLIIHLLRQEELSVGEIAETLGISQSNASQHLAVLRDRGVVLTRREGTTICYRLASERIGAAIDLMVAFVEESPIAPGPRG